MACTYTYLYHDSFTQFKSQGLDLLIRGEGGCNPVAPCMGVPVIGPALQLLRI